MSHRCGRCGAATATGLRLRGFRKDIPDRFRRYVWYCPEHEDDAQRLIASWQAEIEGRAA